jgi:hypothetical protein
MVTWKKISVSFFALGILGFLMAVLYSLSSMIAMYAPPEMMAQESARKGQDFLLIATGIVVLFIASIIAYVLARRKGEFKPSDEEQRIP